MNEKLTNLLTSRSNKILFESVSDNLAAVETDPGQLNGELSPKFVQTLNTDRGGEKTAPMGMDDEDAVSISLTQYYLKGSV